MASANADEADVERELPAALLSRCLALLTPNERLLSALVSKSWRAAAADASAWRHLRVGGALAARLDGRLARALVSPSHGQLHSLTLTGCTWLTDTALTAALASQPHLRSVDVTGCVRLTTYGLVAALSKPLRCAKLRHLRVAGMAATNEWVEGEEQRLAAQDAARDALGALSEEHALGSLSVCGARLALREATETGDDFDGCIAWAAVSPEEASVCAGFACDTCRFYFCKACEVTMRQRSVISIVSSFSTGPARFSSFSHGTCKLGCGKTICARCCLAKRRGVGGEGVGFSCFECTAVVCAECLAKEEDASGQDIPSIWVKCEACDFAFCRCCFESTCLLCNGADCKSADVLCYGCFEENAVSCDACGCMFCDACAHDLLFCEKCEKNFCDKHSSVSCCSGCGTTCCDKCEITQTCTSCFDTRPKCMKCGFMQTCMSCSDTKCMKCDYMQTCMSCFDVRCMKCGCMEMCSACGDSTCEKCGGAKFCDLCQTPLCDSCMEKHDRVMKCGTY